MNPPPPRPTDPPHGSTVAVLGEVLVDVFADGRQVAGGAPFNVARWLLCLGVPTLLVSRTGDGDAAATLLRAEWARLGGDARGLQADALRATGVVRVLPGLTPDGAARPAGEGHRFEIAPDSAWDHLQAAPALPLLRAAQPGVIYFGTLALRSAPSRAAIGELLQATPALRFADLNLRPVQGLQALAELALQQADWVKVNDDELDMLLGWFVTGGTTPPARGSAAHTAAVTVLIQRYALQRLLVTCGAQGWFAVNANGVRDAVGAAPAVPHVVDTVGAGDAFAATLLAACLHGWPLAQALPAASRLASAVCGWQGALPADTAVIRHWRQTLGLGSEPAPA